MLRARDDYEVLRLSPGCPLPVLKKRYREMAVMLHPDKCLVSASPACNSVTLHAAGRWRQGRQMSVVLSRSQNMH